MKRLWLMLLVLVVPVISTTSAVALLATGHAGRWMVWLLAPQAALLGVLAALLMWPWVVGRVQFDWRW